MFRLVKIGIVFLALFSLDLQAQDIHFSQFYNSPLNLNPALAGNFDGNYRFAGNYRNQWSSVTIPFATFSMSGDARNVFGISKAGAGVIFNNDNTGDSRFRTTIFNVAGSYGFDINGDSSNRITAGIQTGVTNKTLSFDYYIYTKILNPISKKICFIHPNIITILGSLITIPMFYNLNNNQSTICFVILGFIRTILDCLDGTIARSCNLGSKLGALLDVLNDTIFTIFIFGLFVYKLYFNQKNYYDKYIIIISTFLIIYMMSQSFNELMNIRTNTNMFKYKLEKVIHDNLNIITPIVLYFIKQSLK